MRRGVARLEDYEAQVPQSKPLTFKARAYSQHQSH
jgi:hypothetical protein